MLWTARSTLCRKQRILKFLDEDSLAARFGTDLFVDLSHRSGLHAVAGGAYADDFRLDAVEFGEALSRRDLPARARARCRASQFGSRVTPRSPRFVRVASRPNRWRRASMAPSRPRISRALRRRSAGSSRTRSISSSVMLARRWRSSAEISFISPSRSRRSISRCLRNRPRRSSTIEPASSAARHASNFATCSAISASARGNFSFAGALVLFDDFAEVVNVVEIEIVEAGGFRGDVARDAEIHDEDGAAARERPGRVRACLASARGRHCRPR